MALNIKPLSDRVLIEPVAAETKTASGIFIPDTAKEKLADVVAKQKAADQAAQAAKAAATAARNAPYAGVPQQNLVAAQQGLGAPRHRAAQCAVGCDEQGGAAV